MAAREPIGPVVPSVFDRLVGLSPKGGMEEVVARGRSVKAFRESVKRDLEWLLNTRQPIDCVPDSCPELQRSLYTYGLRDNSHLSLRSANAKKQLEKDIKCAIDNFEPRLKDVRVSLQPSSDSSRVLHFLIDGLLRIDPAPERIFFDTTLEVSSGEYRVKGEGSGQ